MPGPVLASAVADHVASLGTWAQGAGYKPHVVEDFMDCADHAIRAARAASAGGRLRQALLVRRPSVRTRQPDLTPEEAARQRALDESYRILQRDLEDPAFMGWIKECIVRLDERPAAMRLSGEQFVEQNPIVSR